MNPFEKQFDLIGELTEDCQYIAIEQWKINRHILKMLLEKRLRVTIEPYKEKRSDAQNRYYWLLIGHIKTWIKETTGENLSQGAVHAWVKTKLLGAVPKVKIILGEEVIVMKDIATSKMNTKEFAEMTEIILDKMAERGCYLPEPTDANELHEFLLRDKLNK